jgi:serine/threonine protein kinase
MHGKGIIHADIKAGNIMLGDTSEDADVKIGDMGTAIITNKDMIEVDNLVGTAWFMAPENLQYKYHLASDIWSLGVMTYQLLCGRLPFNDHQNPLNPSISRIWHGILLEHPKVTGDVWDNVGSEAKDFVLACLHKDLHKRPTALAALCHPWLTKTDCTDRLKGKALECKPFVYDEHAMTFYH